MLWQLLGAIVAMVLTAVVIPLIIIRAWRSPKRKTLEEVAHREFIALRIFTVMTLASVAILLVGENTLLGGIVLAIALLAVIASGYIGYRLHMHDEDLDSHSGRYTNGRRAPINPAKPFAEPMNEMPPKHGGPARSTSS